MVAYHVLKKMTPYQELGEAYLDQAQQESYSRHHIRRLEKLGYRVILEPLEAPNVQPLALQESPWCLFIPASQCCRQGYFRDKLEALLNRTLRYQKVGRKKKVKLK